MELKELIFRSLFLIVSLCLAFTSASPQWVWNREVVDSSRFDTGKTSRFPESATERNEIRVEGSSRLFSSAINAISNAIPGQGGSNGGNGVGGLLGALLNRFPQIATSAISGLINRPINIPAKDPGVNFPDESSGSGSGPSGSSSGSSCNCVSSNQCFLPSQPTGSCGGGKVQCCSQTKALFPQDNFSSSSGTKNERTVTQRELRRGLLQQILKGGGSLVDDTLDLILTPYLSKEDQQRLATKVFLDE